MTDNVAHLFAGKLFAKMEVDEMLTPARVLQAKLANEERDKPDASDDSLDLDASGESRLRDSCPLLSSPDYASDAELDTPIAYLSPGSPRPGLARGQTSPALLTTPSPNTPAATWTGRRALDLPTIQEVTARTQIERGPITPSLSVSAPSPAVAEADSSAWPLARSSLGSLGSLGSGPGSGNGSGASSAQLSPTTAHHLSASTRSSCKTRLSQTSGGPLRPTTPGALCSTPYTLTAPLFRHGEIRLSSTRRRRTLSVSSASESETEAAHEASPEAADTLDWTAFQMAISSGAGDFLQSTSVDFGHYTAQPALRAARLDECDVDSLEDWCRGLHLGLGELVATRERPKRPRRSRSRHSPVEHARPGLLSQLLAQAPGGRDNVADAWADVYVDTVPGNHKALCGPA
jgi:hypothetical protein